MDKLRFVYKHYRFPMYWSDSRFANDPSYNGRHGRAIHYQRGVTTWTPAERGGYTQCFVYDEMQNLKVTGLSECSPKDNFSYRIGRTIAKGRALKTLNGN